MPPRRAALVAAALACNPPASGEPAPAPPAAVDPPAPSCEEPPAGALALLPPIPEPSSKDMPEGACPWVLVEHDGQLTARPLILRPGSPGPGAGDRRELERAVEAASNAARRRPVPVLPPADCRPCRYEGVVTPIGPIVLATRPAADSELAAAAWIGAGLPPSPRVDLEPAPLVFAPLWFDRPGLGDSTVQGPPWALAPHLCGRDLVLAPAPRLPGARAEEPPPALVRAAGVYAAAGAELLRQDRPVPSDMSTCAPVPLELP